MSKLRVRLSIVFVFLAILGLAVPSTAQVSYWSNFLTQNGVNYLCAENGGGTSFADVLVADRTAAYAWETFQVIDTDGGSLLDGDHVIIKTINGATVGGPCNTPSTSVSTNASGCLWGGVRYHFWISKVGGSGGSSIASGDQVILQYDSGWTIIADWGGGSTVQLNGTWGPHETFTIYY